MIYMYYEKFCSLVTPMNSPNLKGSKKYASILSGNNRKTTSEINYYRQSPVPPWSVEKDLEAVDALVGLMQSILPRVFN